MKRTKEGRPAVSASSSRLLVPRFVRLQCRLASAPSTACTVRTHPAPVVRPGSRSQHGKEGRSGPVCSRGVLPGRSFPTTTRGGRRCHPSRLRQRRRVLCAKARREEQCSAGKLLLRRNGPGRWRRGRRWRGQRQRGRRRGRVRRLLQGPPPPLRDEGGFVRAQCMRWSCALHRPG